jgi:hypothetical protein
MDHGERLRIMNDHHIMGFQVIANGVLPNYLFINLHFPIAQVDIIPLEGIVHLLGNAEEIGRSVNDSPSCFNTQAVHEKAHGRKEFRHSSAIVGGINVNHMKPLQRFGLFQDPLDDLSSHEGFIIFQLNNTGLSHG